MQENIQTEQQLQKKQENLKSYVSQKGGNEVYLFKILLESQREPYLRLLKFSILQIPIDGDALVDPQVWGVDLPYYAQRKKKVPFLHIAYGLGAYLQSTSSIDKYEESLDEDMDIIKPEQTVCYATFPQLVVEALLPTLNQHECKFLAVYGSLREQIGGMFASPKEAMEHLSKVVLATRFTENSFFSPTFGSLFPYYLNTSFSLLSLVETTVYQFPKIEDNKSLKSTKEEIKKYISQPFSGNILKVDLKWWELLAQSCKRGVLYCPADCSHSADLYYFGEPSIILSWQWKSGCQKLLISDIAKEAEKVFVSSLVGKYEIILTIIAPHFDLKNTEHETNDYCHIIRQDCKLIFSKYKNKKESKQRETVPIEYQVPKGCSIYILTERGKTHFFSVYNLPVIFTKSQQ
jgi:hypothetical protein